MLHPSSGGEIPANIQAELAFLGCALMNPAILDEMQNYKYGPVKPAHLFRESNSVILDVMLWLKKNTKDAIDSITVIDEMGRRTMTGARDQKSLEQHGTALSKIGTGYLTEFILIQPNYFYADHYADIIMVDAIRRQAMHLAQKMMDLAYDQTLTDGHEILARMETMAAAPGEDFSSEGDLESIGDVTQRVVEEIDQKAANPQLVFTVPTGFAMLDRLLNGGFRKKQLIIIGARPSMGKSALSFNMTVNAAKRGMKVAVFSMEMSKEQMAYRALSGEAMIDGNRLRNGAVHEDEWDQLLYGANVLSPLGIYLDDDPDATPAKIERKCRRLQKKHGLDMIVIDYMQLMEVDDTGKLRSISAEQDVSKISRAMKKMAMRLDVPVVVLSQLSRALEQRVDKHPILSDLRQSGSLEQDADIVMFVYREDYYDENTDRQNVADILVPKHRDGPTGTTSLFFRKELTQFRDLEIIRTDLEPQ